MAHANIAIPVLFRPGNIRRNKIERRYHVCRRSIRRVSTPFPAAIVLSDGMPVPIDDEALKDLIVKWLKKHHPDNLK
jgi:hypothetical protein